MSWHFFCALEVWRVRLAMSRLPGEPLACGSESKAQVESSAEVVSSQQAASERDAEGGVEEQQTDLKDEKGRLLDVLRC